MNHKDWTETELRKFIEIHKGEIKTVLEVGCGAGHFKALFDEYEIQWYGIDKEKIKDGEVMFGDFNNIPFHDNKFDLVFACHSFEHTLDPIRTLRELKRVSNNYIFLSTPYSCLHQVLNGDEDHLFCLTDMQMTRLFKWTNIAPVKVYVDKGEEERKEQDWNLISIGAV